MENILPWFNLLLIPAILGINAVGSRLTKLETTVNHLLAGQLNIAHRKDDKL